MQAVETELVNFRQITVEQSIEQRNQLIGNIADLYMLTVDRSPSTLVAVYDDVLIRLADLVEKSALASVSAKMAPLPKAPKGFLRRLAVDDIEIARPVIRQAVELAVDDLLAVARLGSRDHLLELAERKALPEEVSDVVVEIGDREVHRRLSSNDTAAIGARGFNGLMRSARDDETLQHALASRADLPGEIVHALIDVAGEEVRAVLEKRGVRTSEKVINEAKEIAETKMVGDLWLARHDFDSAMRIVSLRARAEPVSEAIIFDYMRGGQFGEGMAALTLMTGLSYENVKRWAARLDYKPFLLVCRALGFARTTVMALIECGPWRHTMERQGRADALGEYDAIDFQVAASVLAKLKPRPAA